MIKNEPSCCLFGSLIIKREKHGQARLGPKQTIAKKVRMKNKKKKKKKAKIKQQKYEDDEYERR